MGRRGRVSSCASCALLGFAVAGLLGPAAVKADIADAMPAFKPHPVRGIPRCAANEELCPVSKGSNELHVSVPHPANISSDAKYKDVWTFY